MTKKDYVLIAGIFASLRRIKEKEEIGYAQGWNSAIDVLIMDFAAVLTVENTKFDKDKFYKACNF